MTRIDSDVIEKLQEHIEVPEIVRVKADRTLEEIKLNAKQEKKVLRPVFKKKKVKAASILLAGMLAFGTVTVGAAAIYQWNQRAAQQMQADESQQKKLMEEGMATGLCTSDENAGVTVEAVQTISDYRYIYIWFQIKIIIRIWCCRMKLLLKIWMFQQKTGKEPME